MEVTAGCGYIACSRCGASVDGGFCCVDVSAGSGGGEVYTSRTTVCYGSVHDGEDSVVCGRFVCGGGIQRKQ